MRCKIGSLWLVVLLLFRPDAAVHSFSTVIYLQGFRGLIVAFMLFAKQCCLELTTHLRLIE